MSGGTSSVDSSNSLLSNRKVAWIAVGIWMVVIFAFSAQAHSGELTEAVFHDHNITVRKSAHMFEYAVLFLLMRNSLKLTPLPWLSGSNIWPFAFSVLYAMTDEFHQYFVPGRSATINDIGVDSIGCCLALLLVTLMAKFRRSR